MKGTRVTVNDILEALASGWSAEEVSENYKISVEAVYEASRFASEAIRRVEVIAIESTS